MVFFSSLVFSLSLPLYLLYTSLQSKRQAADIGDIASCVLPSYEFMADLGPMCVYGPL
jgi:hypothetical protein